MALGDALNGRWGQVLAWQAHWHRQARDKSDDPSQHGRLFEGRYEGGSGSGPGPGLYAASSSDILEDDPEWMSDPYP